MNNITILINDVYSRPTKAVYFKTKDLPTLLELAEQHDAFCAYLKSFGKEVFVLAEVSEFVVSLGSYHNIKNAHILLRTISEIMPVYVECFVPPELIHKSIFVIGYKKDNKVVKLPTLYNQTRRTFGQKEAAMKRLLYAYNETLQEEAVVQTIESIDNIGSNECLIYLYHDSRVIDTYAFNEAMTDSYNCIEEDIKLVGTESCIESRHKWCDHISVILHIPVDISNIKVGTVINYATFEHLETECALEMESINNGAGVGKELFSFDGAQFGLAEDVVFMLVSAENLYKRIN